MSTWGTCQTYTAVEQDSWAAVLLKAESIKDACKQLLLLRLHVAINSTQACALLVPTCVMRSLK
jgi:hypothetical protein